MPIFEYRCTACSEDFEKLVFVTTTQINCPRCGSADVNKKFSVFAARGLEKSVGSGCSSCSSSSCSNCH
jgi:putative FmdB family regulatory protein